MSLNQVALRRAFHATASLALEKLFGRFIKKQKTMSTDDNDLG